MKINVDKVTKFSFLFLFFFFLKIVVLFLGIGAGYFAIIQEFIFFTSSMDRISALALDGFCLFCMLDLDAWIKAKRT